MSYKRFIKPGLTAVLSLFVTLSCSAKTEDKMTITGTLSGVPDQTIYIEQNLAGNKSPQAFLKANIKDGKFSVSGKVDNPPVILSIRFDDKKYQVRDEVIAENSDITLHFEAGKTNSLGMTPVFVTTRGSLSNTKKKEFNIFHYHSQGAVGNEMISKFEALRESGAVNFDLPEEKWTQEQRDKVADLRAEGAVKTKVVNAMIENIFKNNLNNAKGVEAFMWLPGGDEAREENLHLFSKEMQESSMLTYLLWKRAEDRALAEKKQENAKQFAVGKPFVNFVQEDSEGNEVSAKSLLKPNGYLLIDFWASWCGPCRAENPHILKAYKAYKDKGFDVLGISLDDDKSLWLEAVEEDGMPWTQVSDLAGFENEAAITYGVNMIPTNFLLDENGKIVATNLRGEELHSKLEELLGDQ